MRLFKLWIHNKTYSDADLLVNAKEHPNLKIGDVVEIYDPENDFNTRLLLQVTTFLDLKNRDAVSVESSIATQFNLKRFSDYCVSPVNPADVALDSIEITFKDQYMGRSEMWRLKVCLTNTCVYVNKKIEFCEMLIRCQVYEMWSQGQRVSSGVICDDTKMVFRSSTSLVYLFLQMSSEMWDFDIHGDLYFEKAVNGFLTELFHKWKKLACNHEVTIVLFSRTFYDSKSLDEFPEHMHDCLQMDYKGRFYEDFYRVAIQNERNDDWCSVLAQLRKIFTTYQSTVLRHHERTKWQIPPAMNSTAAQGNFLEVLNISLNTFDKHYLERAFDRTGQLSVVITPGVGVFEVDRELTNITKQRIIDNGVGSDLVCVGEQPLHAVPLLKFHNKDTTLPSVDDYSLPHWINLSFYTTNKKIGYSNFIPRIKLPATIVNPRMNGGKNFLRCSLSEYIHNSLFDYDANDEQIFQPPTVQGTCSLQQVVRAKKTSVPSLATHSYENNESTKRESRLRKLSDPCIHHGTSSILKIQPDMLIGSEYINNENIQRSIVAKVSIVRPGRALINPFDPSHVTIKLTSNRRRWTHIFPKGPTGLLVQQHHYQAVPISNTASKDGDNSGFLKSDNLSDSDLSEYLNTTSELLHKVLRNNPNTDKTNFSKRPKISNDFNSNEKVLPVKSFLWGATGEQEWTPAITTGVDWKSLTIPACLPITTDYFPDKRSLHNDYVVSDYTLLPDDVNSDSVTNRSVYRTPFTTKEVFKELVSQRLAQGFQLIVFDNKNLTLLTQQQQQKNNSIYMQKNFSNMHIKPPVEKSEEYLLSIGRIFHKISLRGSVITVTGYRPRHPYPPISIDYRYRFYAPQHETYEISGVSFTSDKLENFNWNYMDHYICTRGDSDYSLNENLKYWRYRMYLLPKENPAMNVICDSTHQRCDIFTEIFTDNTKQQVNEFMRFLELHINKLKRGGGSTKIRHNTKSKTTERHSGSSSTISSQPSSITLRPNATIIEILEAMKHPINGIQFFSTTPNLPSNTFLSYDALLWLKTHLVSSRNPLEVLQTMQKEKIICHASGNWNKPVIPGFYLYFIVPTDKTNKDLINSMNDFKAFETDWMEIELQGCSHLWMDPIETEQKMPNFLKNQPSSQLWPEYSLNGEIYRHSHLEIDVNQKSDRMEWGHVKYHTVMEPGFAFEIAVEWLTSSGPIVWDLINGWKRKANQCGFQFVPVPADPIAEPFTEKSDPLRGPIFIPLNVMFLPNDAELFEEFSEESRSDRILLLQEAILERFGFMPCVIEKKQQQQNIENLPKEFLYVHSSGTVFILIRGSQNIAADDLEEHDADESNASPFGGDCDGDGDGSGQAKEDRNSAKRVGYLWAWNYMIPNKKWKSFTLNYSSNEEIFQFKLLKDFRDFCSNNDNRLLKFWEDCKEKQTRQRKL